MMESWSRLPGAGNAAKLVAANSKSPPPIDTLPSELLVHIVSETVNGNSGDIRTRKTPQDEQHCLAKEELFGARFLGLPSLARHHYAHTQYLVAYRRLLRIVGYGKEESGLRSCSHPLTLCLSADSENSDFAVRLLRWFSAYSQRWREVQLQVASNSSCFLSGAKGKLDQLETLGIYYSSVDDVNPPFDAFAIAPRLHSFDFHGVSKCRPCIPWRQLKLLRWTDEDFSCSSIPLLPLGELCDGCHTNLYLVAQDHTPTLLNTPIESRIASLSLWFSMFNLDIASVNPILDVFFDSFTLPQLQELILLTVNAPSSFFFPIMWRPSSTQSFAALARRSGFRRSLLRLQICVPIAEDALFEVLGLLPLLETITIGDVHPYAVGIGQQVTDSLLARFTQSMHITPQLRRLSLLTLLHFEDDSLVQLLYARASRKFKFELEVFCIAHPLRDIYEEPLQTKAERIEPKVLLRIGVAPPDMNDQLGP
ncbi:F-box domain-containing protein [Mycena indigotica]|uniref:F-box domain-containing protein n=1 Tax=Mycena indigotica TaxID=2126181 RepID=A0A8H6SS29_9AGAR|nr:F-box domain-containing protein [Mycena indigotica]KAF7304020.1 F-box domain-containing protein [Mycena indigotica]